MRAPRGLPPGGKWPTFGPWSELDYRNVGCALCHVKDDEPMMFTLPPMDYPGLRDSRADIRLHRGCHALLVNIIGAALFTGLYGSGVPD